MADYLELVNKVLLESGKEQNLLDYSTWDSQEAGRRIYPRVKRLVREAWKSIQMSRNEWEFNTAELTTTVYPRLKYIGGWSSDGAVPQTWRGSTSNTVFQLRDYATISGSWEDGTAKGWMELEVLSGSYIEIGEVFSAELPDEAEFTFLEKGSYDFLQETNGLIREPHWTTFVAGRNTAYPNPVLYIPWDNFTYKSYSFVGTSQSVPNYVSQDYEGKLVFYPQPLAPFMISFVHDVAPQELQEPEDEPYALPEEYHEWIAWKALMALARFDKDPDLFAYAQEHYNEYQRRAERSLLPIPRFSDSRFNKCKSP